jgi:hypothetical protein
MAAIITENFRRRTASLLLSDLKTEPSININDNNGYYVGIGKSDRWLGENESSFIVPTPIGTPNDEREVLSNLTTLIRVRNTDTGLVIPNIKYKTNSYFKEYDPTDDSCFYPAVRTGGEVLNPCYTVVNGNIYLCLRAGLTGNGLSTVTPLQPGYGAYVASDNYVWALVDKINLSDSTIINTDQFITVNSDTLEGAEATSAQNDSGGLLYGFSVMNGGSDYNPTITSIQFIANYENESTESIPCQIVIDPVTRKIVSVSLPTNWDYNNEDSLSILGGHFDFSSLEGPGLGSGAIITPKISPIEGFAYKPSSILPAWYVSIAVSAAGNISDDGLYIPYRQISVIRNPEFEPSTIETDETIDTLAACRYLVISALPQLNGLITGDVITFNGLPGSPNPRAFYDAYDLVDGQHRIYFHQNDATGYGLIKPGTSGYITHVKNATQISYASVVGNEYTPLTGEVLFTENRRAVTRAESQTEQIKIIIQL